MEDYGLENYRNRFLRSYHEDNIEKAMDFGEKLIAFRRERGLDKTVDFGRDLYNLGVVYDELKNYDKARDTYTEARNIIYTYGTKENNPQIADCLGNLGVVLYKLGKRREGMEAILKCYEIRRDTCYVGHPDLIGIVYNIGSICLETGNYKNSIKSLVNCLCMRKHRDQGYADNLYKLGFAYMLSGDPAIGSYYIKAAVNVYGSIDEYSEEEYAAIVNNYASRLMNEAHDKEAIEWFDLLINYMKEKGISKGLMYISALIKLADCHYNSGNRDVAIRLKQKAINIFKNSGGNTSTMFYARTVGQMGDMYFNNDEYEKAAEFYSEATNIAKRLIGYENEITVTYIESVEECYFALGETQKCINILKDAIEKLEEGTVIHTKILVRMASVYFDLRDSKGINSCFEIFNRVFPNKTFDEMIDLIEGFSRKR